MGCSFQKDGSGVLVVEHRHDLVLDLQAATLELFLGFVRLRLHPRLDAVNGAVQLVVLVIEPREAVIARLQLMNPVGLVGEILVEVVWGVAHRLQSPWLECPARTTTPPALFSFHI